MGLFYKTEKQYTDDLYNKDRGKKRYQRYVDLHRKIELVNGLRPTSDREFYRERRNIGRNSAATGAALAGMVGAGLLSSHLADKGKLGKSLGALGVAGGLGLLAVGIGSRTRNRLMTRQMLAQAAGTKGSKELSKYGLRKQFGVITHKKEAEDLDKQLRTLEDRYHNKHR